MTGGRPAGHAIRWTGDNLDAVFAFMRPVRPATVTDPNGKGHTRIGVPTPDGGLQVASVGDWIVRTGTTLTVQHAEDSDR